MIEPIAIVDNKTSSTHTHDNNHPSIMAISYHDSEDDDTTTTTTTAADNIDFFEEELSTLDDYACYQNTYFMDGGNRFISVSTSKQYHPEK